MNSHIAIHQIWTQIHCDPVLYEREHKAHSVEHSTRAILQSDDVLQPDTFRRLLFPIRLWSVFQTRFFLYASRTHVRSCWSTCGCWSPCETSSVKLKTDGSPSLQRSRQRRNGDDKNIDCEASAQTFCLMDDERKPMVGSSQKQTDQTSGSGWTFMCLHVRVRPVDDNEKLPHAHPSDH